MDSENFSSEIAKYYIYEDKIISRACELGDVYFGKNLHDDQ